jgi:hypothetical protein
MTSCLTCANVAVVDKVSCDVALGPMVAGDAGYRPGIQAYAFTRSRTLVYAGSDPSGVPCEPESAVILGVWTLATQWGSL